MLKMNNTHCNVENMMRVRAFIEELPGKNFNMAELCSNNNECGTVACIAGWAYILENEIVDVVDLMDLKDAPFVSSARQYLGLTPELAEALFYCRNLGPEANAKETCNPALRMLYATKWHAIQAIDNVIAHGDPKWEEIIG